MFDDNFDIQRQLEHFKYEMNQTLEKIKTNITKKLVEKIRRFVFEKFVKT
jgi:hypothetical protein